MKSNNIIELNGKLYDAKTGVPLQKKTPATHTSANKPKTQRIKSVDGFSPRSTGASKVTRTTSQATPKSISVKKEAQHSPKPSVHRSASQSVKRTAKRSTTLNRSVVHAPTFAVSAPIAESAPALPQETFTSSALKHADSSRISRAKQVNKSSVISRFGSNQTVSPKKEVAPVPELTQHLQKTHEAPTKASTAEQKRTSTKERLIKKAIDAAIASNPVQAANSKQSKNHISKRSRKTSYATTAVAALLVAGYVAYLNVPSISMKVAAHRAGFAANLPGYKPAGYSLKGPIAYSPGQVTLNFASNTDQRRFTLKQQPTTWDSTALLENFVTKKSPNYLTYQDSGLTIYIIDGSSAAWVNGGKLYHVEGKNSQLDTDQLLKLATSV